MPTIQFVNRECLIRRLSGESISLNGGKLTLGVFPGLFQRKLDRARDFISGEVGVNLKLGTRQTVRNLVGHQHAIRDLHFWRYRSSDFCTPGEDVAFEATALKFN